MSQCENNRGNRFIYIYSFGEIVKRRMLSYDHHPRYFVECLFKMFSMDERKMFINNFHS
jgi:hypothetical protein